MHVTKWILFPIKYLFIHYTLLIYDANFPWMKRPSKLYLYCPEFIHGIWVSAPKYPVNTMFGNRLYELAISKVILMQIISRKIDE